jgi:pimeloyl-ACP methyl ester carboxylesterase
MTDDAFRARDARIDSAGATLAVESSGDGPSVLLLHGPAIDSEVFEATEAGLGADLRITSYDRRGYGRSPTEAPLRGTTVSEQAEDAVRVIASLELAPTLVVGHDVAALVALDLVLRHPALVRGAVLVEPALLSLVPAGRELAAQIVEVIQRGARDDGPGGAVEAYLEHVGGPGALERLGHDRLTRARANARPFAADLAAAPAWRYAPRELRGIQTPVTLVVGSRTAPARRAAGVRLAEMIPGASLVELDAGHLVPVDDPDGLAAAVRAAAYAAGSTKKATTE